MKKKSEPIPSPFGINIYIDESGDLGFPNGSDYFVLGAVIAPQKIHIEQCNTCVGRAKRKISKNYPYDELKSHRLKEENREKVAREILKTDLNFGYLLLRKKEVIADRWNHHSLYNWLTAKLIEKVIFQYYLKADVHVIIDKSLYGINREEFNHCIKARKVDIFNGRDNLNVDILHVNSEKVAGIQVADFIAGTTYQHYSRYKENPTDQYNFFPQIYERSTIRLNFFENQNNSGTQKGK